MKIKPYVEKLNSSKEFKEFMQKYPNSFMVAGFLVLDLEMGKNIHQIDYYIPSEKKFAAFTLDSKVQLQLLNSINEKVPEKLDMATNTDLDALYGIIEDEMKNRSMTSEVKKIIAVLQNIKGKKIWSLNCLLSGMEILKAHVEDSSKTVLKMEKNSLIDLMKRIPGAQGLGLQSGEQKQKNGEESEKGEKVTLSDDEMKVELKKLEQLEKAIAKEKDQLKKQSVKTAKIEK